MGVKYVPENELPFPLGRAAVLKEPTEIGIIWGRLNEEFVNVSCRDAERVARLSDLEILEGGKVVPHEKAKEYVLTQGGVMI